MLVEALLSVGIISYACSVTGLACPTNCSCQVDTSRGLVVDCTGLGFYSPPRDLPQATVYLDLSSNKITTWNISFIERLVHLQTLDMSHNSIEEISDGKRQWSFRNSDGSFLSSHLGDKPVLPFRSRCPSLKTLLLRNNKISSIGDHAFAECSSLKLIDLSYNKLGVLQKNSFRGLYDLKSLNLFQNHLDFLPDTYPRDVFVDQAKLEVLNIKGNYRPNRLQTLPGVNRGQNRFGKTRSSDHETRVYPQSSVHNRQDRLYGTESSHNETRVYPDASLASLVTLQVLLMDALHCDILPGVGFRAITNLTLLDLTGSKDLEELPETFFSNFTTRKPLQLLLGDCGLTFIHPNSFSYLPTLTALYLRDNVQLEFSGFEIGSRSLHKTQIKSLDISRIHLSSLIVLQGESFRNIKYLSLEELKVEHNYIYIVNATVAGYLPRSLRKLDITYNRLNEIEFLFGLVRLMHLEVLNVSVQNKWRSGDSKIQSLDLSQISRHTKQQNSWHVNRTKLDLTEYPQETVAVPEGVLLKLQTKFCPDTMSVAHTRPPRASTRMFNVSKALVAMLDREQQGVVLNVKNYLSYGGVPLPQNLRVISASQLKLGLVVPEVEVQTPNALEIFDLSWNFLWCLGGPMKGFDKLQSLDLSNNYFIMLSPIFFENLSSLRTLILKNNILGPSLEQDYERLTFARLYSLEILDLSLCDIKKLDENVFDSNRRLKKLFLEDNALRDFSVNISHMRNLTVLDLSGNDLLALPPSTLASLDLIATGSLSVSVDLSRNPLVCDCSTRPFLEWVTRTRVTLKNVETYRCTFFNGSSISLTDAVDDRLMKDLSRVCFGPSVFPGVLLCFFMLVSVLTSFAVYSYFSSRLLFLLYVSKRRYFRTFCEPVVHGIRDVFLVFDDEHRGWRSFVARELRPALESRGVSIYLRQVHGLAGRPTRLVVEEAVLSGKKTLVLVSRRLFDCDDRELEINMALLSEEMRVTEVLVFLFLEEIPAAEIPEHVLRVLEDRPAYFYSGNTHKFWDNLARVLKPE